MIAFLGWAAMCWAVTGQPFPQFASKYGNTALIASSTQTATTLAGRILHEIEAITSIGPLFALIAAAALAMAVRRRNPQLLGVLALLGGGIGFTLVSYAADAIFPWYRYYILFVALQVLLVGSLFAPPGPTRGTPCADPVIGNHDPMPRNLRKRPLAALVAAALSIVALAPSIYGTAQGMDDVRTAPDILHYYGFIFHEHLDAQDEQAQAAYSGVRSIARYLDRQDLANGDVIVDTSDNCMPNVVTNVDNPRMFVIPNDRDFQRVLDDPLRSHAHYLLVQGSGSAQADAVGQQYPNLGTGSSWATLVHTFPAQGLCVPFRLFRVTGHPTGIR